MEEPRFSVVIPSYNRYQRLLYAVESARHPETEIIAIDDGSEPPVASRVGDRLPGDVQLITQTNHGIPYTRNVGQRAARGEYLSHLDSDDYFVDGRLQRCIDVLDRHPDVDFLFHDLGRFNQDSENREFMPNLHSQNFPAVMQYCTEDRRTEENCYRLKSQEVFRLLTGGFSIFPSAVVLRRRVMDRIAPWDENLVTCSDLDYFSRALVNTDALYLHEPLTMKGHGEDNISRFEFKQKLNDIRILEGLQGNPEVPAEYQQILGDSLNRRYSHLGWMYKKEAKYDKARQAYQTALKYHASTRVALNYVYTLLKSQQSRYLKTS